MDGSFRRFIRVSMMILFLNERSKRDEFTSKNIIKAKERFNLKECCYLDGWQLSPFYRAVDDDSFSQ
ncbi:hypothetical protein [Bacillus sp. FJAT-53711]|uniref:hypothetical protein n=1 Tax=Bacillus yunxiaonensis TaxID=3127665 RepID=UPI0030140BFE